MAVSSRPEYFLLFLAFALAPCGFLEGRERLGGLVVAVQVSFELFEVEFRNGENGVFPRAIFRLPFPLFGRLHLAACLLGKRFEVGLHSKNASDAVSVDLMRFEEVIHEYFFAHPGFGSLNPYVVLEKGL